jgi:pyrroloquinoline-quinone synthase
MTSENPTTIERIDALIDASDPASEPLIEALASGALSRDDLRVFAGQYFHVIDALPRFVSTVHSVTADPNWRRMLLNVLSPLELNPPSAADLWLQTCAAIGLFSDTVRSGEPTTATAVCLGDFEYLCQSGSAQGFAALYAWMGRLPRVCKALQQALADQYDIVSGPGVQFFEVLGFQGKQHARILRSGLVQILETYPQASDAAYHAADDAIRAVKGMYVGALAASR